MWSALNYYNEKKCCIYYVLPGGGEGVKYCYTCNTNYTDDAQYCPKCVGALTFFQNTDMNNQQYRISDATNSPQSKKKKSKKLIIGVVSVLLVLIIAVATVVLIKLNEKPEEDFYAENLPKKLLEYKLNGEEYVSEPVELTIISQNSIISATIKNLAM